MIVFFYFSYSYLKAKYHQKYLQFKISIKLIVLSKTVFIIFILLQLILNIQTYYPKNITNLNNISIIKELFEGLADLTNNSL